MGCRGGARHLPVGLAFYTWDYGVKKGDIQLLGAASYAAPLLSTGRSSLAALQNRRGGLQALAC